MFSLAIVLVIISGLLHAVWNLLAKQALNKVVFLWSFQWVAVVLYLPWALAAIGLHPVPARGWILLVVTAAMHGMYVLLLARTYSLGDLSQVYPLMRGVSPFLVPVFGVALLGEHITGPGWVGIGAIIVGIGMLGDWHRPLSACRSSRWPSQAMWLALAVGLSITTYTILDKVTLHDVPAVALNDGSNIGNLVALTWWAVRSGAVKREWVAHWKTIIVGGIISPGGYLLFLTAIQMAPVARLAPIREIGIVFATILGVVLLKEAQGRKRLGASGLITAGAILLAARG